MSIECVQSLFEVPAGHTLSATNGGGPTSVPVNAGIYFMPDLVAEVQSQLNILRPTGWTLTLDSEGRVTIACSSVPFSIAWTSTTLRDALGFGEDILTSFGPVTGMNQAKFLWYPNAPIALDGNPATSPHGDDGRATISPRGDVYGIVSSARPFKHRNVRFEMVDQSRVWDAVAIRGNASWERFYLESQRGDHPWGTAFAPMKVLWNNGGTQTELGGGIAGVWRMPRPVKLDELKLSVAGYVGLVDIVLGDLYSIG